MAFMKDYDHLKIQMKDIISATNNFDPTKVIGGGGFGQVYKGELSLPEGQTTVAFKQLDRRLGQGNIEFWKEIMMLSKYKHENLISLKHFCIEGKEMILVYEYASRGSLDCYLSDASLTWTQRLKICVGAARGLNFLHDPLDTQQRLIHRDIKSANILLDEKWMAKVSDFGLSKAGPANQAQTYMVSNAVGTPGYCDPLYLEMGFLSKESDVYSFGVMLFEILSGRLCCEYRNGQLTNILVPNWKRCFDEKRLDEIILACLKEQMEPGSLDSFATISYRCLNRAREERPTMVEVLKELEFALQQQEVFEAIGKKVNFEKLIKIADSAVPPLSYVSQSHLFVLFLKGVLVDYGKTWISTNMREEISEIVSAIKCVTEDQFQQEVVEYSRFPYVLTSKMINNFNVDVTTQYLSPNVTYTINIVFKHQGDYNVHFKYKLEEETQYWASNKAHEREDGWLKIQLYQFTSFQAEHNFKIEFIRRTDKHDYVNDTYYIDGIEFLPVEQEKYGTHADNNKVDIKAPSDSDTDWEQKLPSVYQDITKLSKDVLPFSTKKELYFLLRKGFLIDNDKMWFSISKDIQKRFMIPATSFLPGKEWKWKRSLESRFNLVAEVTTHEGFSIDYENKSQLFSYHAAYSCHLIYKKPENDFWHAGLMLSGNRIPGSKFINLFTFRHTPFIGPKDDQKTQRSIDRHKLKGHPKQRKDGWMEFQFAEVSAGANGTIKLHYGFSFHPNMDYFDLVVEGIEFRPL